MLRMPGVTREQIARAKSVAIEDYILAREPNNVRRVGNAYYLKDHESLEISNGLWSWHSRGIGGGNVVDYLIKVRGYGFVDAVRCLAGEDQMGVKPVVPKARAPNPTQPKGHKPFEPPPRNSNNECVAAYLKGRGIDRDLILGCIERGSLYESAHWHNCVFVGHDGSGKARFAALRGTKGSFKRDADGSDKRFGFVMPPKNPETQAAAVFESPIDALSHACLEPGFDGWRLSLGCTALAALRGFLERHSEIKTVVTCTDNDEAGNLAAAKIAELPGISVLRPLPPGGHKDWSEALQSQSNRNEVREMEDVRKNIRFIGSDYTTLFTVKDGESIKFTSGYDGESKTLKCRFIDETHMQLIGKHRNDYHICEFAEITERNGSKSEPIPGQKPMIDILSAKYGEKLMDTTIPMTEAAVKKLVGGSYKVETLYGASKDFVFGALLRGKNGIAVCGIDDNTLTSLHPYWAQKYKRELSPAERPNKQSLLKNLEKAKVESGTHSSVNRAARERAGDAPCL
jgi:hypothetical protein